MTEEKKDLIRHLDQLQEAGAETSDLIIAAMDTSLALMTRPDGTFDSTCLDDPVRKAEIKKALQYTLAAAKTQLIIIDNTSDKSES